MYKGPIIDTHMHLWDTANGYAWLPKVANGALNRNFLTPDYLEMSKKQPISQMVHVECGGFPENPVLETKWVQKQADKYGGPQAIVGFAKLESPELERVLKGHLESPNFRAIRMPLNYVAGSFGAERDDYMKDASWRKGYALLSKYNLPFEMQIFDTQIPDASDLAKVYSDIPIILEHLGWPKRSTLDDLPSWKERLAQMAQHPNVILKISCLGWIFQKNEPQTIIPYIREAVRLFGPNRCMVGSNCPPDTVYLSFDEIFSLMQTALSIYSPTDVQKIFHDTAKRIYNL